MPIERWRINDEEQWKAWRKEFVTASAAGALFNCHPYCSPLRLYMEKSGVELPEPDSSVLRRGKLLESSVAAAVAEQHPEWRLVKNVHFYADTDARLGCTPDYTIHGDPRGMGVLQCKTVAPHVYKRDWTETDPPFWIVVQNLIEIDLTGAAFGIIAPLVVDPFDLKCPLYDVPPHAKSQARIRDAVATFWEDVAEGNEPDPDYGLDRDLIALLAPSEAADEIVDLSSDNEVMSGLIERADLKKRMAIDEERCDEIEAMIMARMGTAAIARVPDFKVSWKTTHFKEYTVAARDKRVLRIFDRREDAA